MENRMKIAISSYDAGRLAAARRAGESRKNIWAAIRAQFGIPTSVKLAMDAQRVLYKRGTDPREYLIAGSDGMYSHCAADGASQQPVQMLESDTTRFTVVGHDAGTASWACMSAVDVSDTLREHGDYDLPVSLPDGFPTDAGRDAVVVDTVQKVVYFRVD